MYKNIRNVFIIIVVLLSLGCSKFFADLRSSDKDSDGSSDSGDETSENQTNPTQEVAVKPPFKNGTRATKDDFVDQSQEEGSLWASSGQTNYYFTKNKVRSPGDIVTLKIENDLFRGISDEIKKSLSTDEKMVELVEAKDQLREKLMKNVDVTGKDRLTTSAASPEKLTDQSGSLASPADVTGAGVAPPKVAMSFTLPEIDKQVMQLSVTDLDITPRLEIKNGDMMMGEIVGRYPNGNYKIRATKKVLYKKGPAREVTVLAVVKAADIGEDTDTVNSGKLYDYQVEVAH